MKLNNFLIGSICSVVYNLGVSAKSPFLEKGKRPEIFELTDDEIAVFKVTLTDEDFALLKEKASSIKGLSPIGGYLSDEFDYLKKEIRTIINYQYYCNFTERYPGYDFSEGFTGLYLSKDGFPDVDKIMDNLNFDVKNYVDFDFVFGDIYDEILSKGKYNYTEILSKLNYLNEIYSPQMNTYDRESTVFTRLSQTFNSDTEFKSVSHLLTNFNITEYPEYPEYTEYDSFEIDDSTFTYNFEDDFYDSMDNYFTDSYYDYDGEEETYNVGIISYEPNTDFKTRDGKLTVNIAGKEKSFDQITFSLSGEYSRTLVKPNFNLKISGDEDLYGRSQFKLRSDLTEPTFLRSKLTSDIHNVLGLTSILANYATLYINDEYMGLFVLTDSYKKSWVKKVYNEENTFTLHKCENSAYINEESINRCPNENDDIDFIDGEEDEFREFLQAVDKAESAEDIEDIFEVEDFIYEMAIEYLLGAWDHIQLGHNFYLYKQPNGKWKYLTYDHDHSFGINIDRIVVGNFFLDLPERNEKINRDYPNYSFEDWTYKHHVIDILILKDPTRFSNAIKDIVTRVFNPATLFPRIDELKDFIRPLAEKDYTPDKKGNYPGRINTQGNNPYTFEHWEANSEFTTVETLQYNAYGIKYWILAKYRKVCKDYNILCDPVYLDENYKFDVDEAVEFKDYDFILNSNFTNPIEEPTSVIEEPTLLNEEPILMNEEPTLMNEEPTLMNEEPTLMNEEPTLINEEPILLNEEPTLINEEPTLINEKPTLINEEQTLNEKPTLINEEQTLNEKPTLINEEPTLNEKPTLIDEEPTLNEKPSLINEEPILNEKPSLINEEPILNEKPSLINEEPTLNEKPFLINEVPALNEKPTLNEEPTLNEKPTLIELGTNNGKTMINYEHSVESDQEVPNPLEDDIDSEKEI